MFPKPNFKPRKPKRGQRGRITKSSYQDALDYYGETCTICGNYPIEMHHVVFRSQGGRGGYRNLMPLCKHHHDKAHSQRTFADELRAEREEIYGKHFSCDRFDLFEHGHIDDPNEKAFEDYMKSEEIKK